MKLLAVSVSKRREIPHNGKTLVTAMFKRPVERRVMLRTLRLDGDEQADLKAHGGVNKAACVYTIENYEHWKLELGRTDFEFAQFGENLTVEGMLEDAVHVGDVFRIGDARVQVTQPRVPCFKLGIKMEHAAFPKMFLQSGRVGFYFRVVEEGEVGAGDRIDLVEQDPEAMSVRDICHLYYFERDNLAACEGAIRIEALSPGWREGFQARLRKAGVAVDGAEAPLDDAGL